MATNAGPAVSSWGDDFKSLFFDYARYKTIDVEQVGDDNNIPDRVDVKTGNVPVNNDNYGGLFTPKSKQVAMIGGGLLLGGGLLYMLFGKKGK